MNLPSQKHEAESSEEYQEFLEYKKNKGKIPSFAKIIAEQESEENKADYLENRNQEVVLLLETRDMKWENNPWTLMSRYLDKASYALGTYKTRYFYESILLNTESCEISHFSGIQKEVYNFSKIYIKKIISSEEWGIAPLREREFYYSNNRNPIKFNYWDYVEAFNKVLLYENDKKKHSWFIKISSEAYEQEIPNWFLNWWKYFGTTGVILPQNFTELYSTWIDVNPKKDIPSDKYDLYFFMEFSIPWIWKWVPIIGYTEHEIPCIKRSSYTKFWDKMNKRNPETRQLYCIDTINLIEKRIKWYQENRRLVAEKEESPHDQIKKKFSMKDSNREMFIEAYIEEIKKDLLQGFDGETQSVKSDTSMVSASQDCQDAQDPNQEEVSIEDVFEILKGTLKKGKDNGESSTTIVVAEKSA